MNCLRVSSTKFVGSVEAGQNKLFPSGRASVEQCNTSGGQPEHQQRVCSGGVDGHAGLPIKRLSLSSLVRGCLGNAETLAAGIKPGPLQRHFWKHKINLDGIRMKFLVAYQQGRCLGLSDILKRANGVEVKQENMILLLTIEADDFDFTPGFVVFLNRMKDGIRQSVAAVSASDVLSITEIKE